MIKADFYDIESLRNLFTLANFHDNEDPTQTVIDLYYLCDDEDKLFSEPDWQDKMRDRIYMRNLNFSGRVYFKNLKKEVHAEHLAKTFGLSDARFMNDPDEKSNYKPEFRIVCDTDPEYDDTIYPYFFGYNSYNYDTTMLAYYFSEVWDPARTKFENGAQTAALPCRFTPKITAAKLREFNDFLFTPHYKNAMPSALAYNPERGNRPDYSTNAWRIRKNMLMSGRHLDVARLNEKQSKVGLKRLLGMLGWQILESDKLDTGLDTIETPDQLYDLVAYNISDVVNLKNLFYHSQYQAQFELKKGLLATYPELVYLQQSKGYKPHISQKTVRSDRLTIDSSSAQFATKSLCPYGHLRDIETVSFNYPSENQAKIMGIQQVNVLEEAKKFFYGLYPQPELRSQFDVIYNFYKNIEGRNFNDSDTYMEDFVYQNPDGTMHQPRTAEKLAEVAKEGSVNTCLPYFDKDGKPTSCFVLFSTGGVHGAEFNVELYNSDVEAWNAMMADMEEAKRQYPDPVELRKARKIIMPDGRELGYNVFLNSPRIADSTYKDFEKKKPMLFKESKSGGWSLNPKYTFTSTCEANHEDFTSYYPNLLRRMEAFFNKGLGYDRYAEIFQQKQDFGKYMKDKARPADEREHYRILREGTKLVLNSASGAADAMFENNIRVNNQIISMRCIGQLFSWRIGQAQSFAGAKIPSTNTDGLYSVMEETLNNAILEKESANIGVDIEPEPLYLISKDANNRIEIDEDTGKIISASGGTTGCRKGPNPTKSLAHPAIIDWALTEYLIIAAKEQNGISMSSPFNNDIGRSILERALTEFDKVQTLLMFQNIIASSSSSITYIYGKRDGEDEPIVLQNYNRMFIMKDGTPNTMHLWNAAARVVTPAMKKKRAKDNLRPTAEPDPDAFIVLKANGETINGKPLDKLSNLYPDKDIVTKKVTNIEPEWDILIDNRDLHMLSDTDFQFIIDNIDIEKYLKMLDNAYTNNWMNKIPGVEYAEVTESEEDEDTGDE